METLNLSEFEDSSNNTEEERKIYIYYNFKFYFKKIPHTGDKSSLDRCG